MTDLQKVEMLTKALQDGKTLEHRDGRRFKMINGMVCNLDGILNVDIGDVKYLSIQEPKPEFKITENQLAEYECRNGSKAISYGCFIDNKAVVIFEGGMFSLVNSNGKQIEDKECPNDIIRKIKEL